MNRTVFLQRPHEGDFNNYIYHLNERNKTNTDLEVVSMLKGLHRKIFYLNLLSQSLNTNPTERSYFNEIIVDLILCMDLFSLNYIKPARMGLRAAIEEFNRLLLIKIKEEITDLSVYKLNQTVKVKFNQDHIKDKISQLLSDYGQLCDFTHVSSSNTFTDKLVLEDFKTINRPEIQLIAKQVMRIVENMIFVIICQYKNDFLSFNKHMQSYILEQLSATYREAVNSILDE